MSGGKKRMLEEMGADTFNVTPRNSSGAAELNCHKSQREQAVTQSTVPPYPCLK
jgi:hypothetical protein